MEESTLILTYAGMGLVVMMIGFIVFFRALFWNILSNNRRWDDA